MAAPLTKLEKDFLIIAIQGVCLLSLEPPSARHLTFIRALVRKLEMEPEFLDTVERCPRTQTGEPTT